MCWHFYERLWIPFQCLHSIYEILQFRDCLGKVQKNENWFRKVTIRDKRSFRALGFWCLFALLFSLQMQRRLSLWEVRRYKLERHRDNKGEGKFNPNCSCRTSSALVFPPGSRRRIFVCFVHHRRFTFPDLYFNARLQIRVLLFLFFWLVACFTALFVFLASRAMQRSLTSFRPPFFSPLFRLFFRKAALFLLYRSLGGSFIFLYFCISMVLQHRFILYNMSTFIRSKTYITWCIVEVVIRMHAGQGMQMYNKRERGIFEQGRKWLSRFLDSDVT